MECPSEEVVLEYVEHALDPRRADELRAHLADCAECVSVVAAALEATPPEVATRKQALEQSAGASSGSAGGGRAGLIDGGEPLRLDGGGRVGRYIILSVLGAGNMGVVYSAHDPELGRRVALKLLRPLPEREGNDRDALLKEARAMALLSHPNVVQVYDAGSFGEQIFIAMELVEGSNLRDWLASGARGWREILALFLDAGRGLAAAHAAGLVHRDFKPDNVLVGDDGRAMITDFGLARFQPAAEQNAPALAIDASAKAAAAAPGGVALPAQSGSALTPAGAIPGTPAYMAPEQMDGAPAGAASDLFAYCVALFEALYGVRPFAGRTAFELRASIRAGEVREAPREKRVPGWLHRLVVGGLAADPAARPRSMQALLQGLKADPVRRRLRILGGAALALTAIGIGVLLHWAAAARAASCASEAAIVETAWNASRREAMRARFAESGVPYASGAFAGASSLLDKYARDWSAMRTASCEATRVDREQPEETFALRAACLDRLRGELAAMTDLFLHADKKIIDHAVSAARTLGDLDACANVTALAAPVPPPRDPAIKARLDAAMNKVVRADAQRRAGVDNKATVAMAAPALEELRAIGHAPSLAYAESVLGRVQGRLGDQEAARSLCEAALFDGTRGRDEKQVLSALRCLTPTFAYHLGRIDEGLLFTQLALATIEGFDNSASDVVEVKRVRSAIYLATGRLDEALDDERAAIAALEATRGKDCAVCLEWRSNLGQVLISQGRIEEARATFAAVLPPIEKLVGKGHPETLPVTTNLSWTLLVLGRVGEAAPLIEAMAKSYVTVYGEKHINTGIALTNLGELRLAQGRPEEGLEVERQAIAVFEPISPEHPALAEPLTQAGLALVALGRAEESLPLFERALAIAKQASAPTDLARIQFGLARGLLALRRDPERAAELAAAGRKAFADAAAHYGGENARLAEELAPPLDEGPASKPELR